MQDVVQKVVEDLVEKQEMWLRAVLLSELGEEMYGKSDKEIALEAQARGYQLISYPATLDGGKWEIQNREGKVISTFTTKMKIN